MNPIKMLAVVLAAAAVGAAVAAASAQAAKYESARFKATVEGVQTVNWSKSSDEDGTCMVTHDNTGSEKVKFGSSKPVIVSAFKAPGSKRPSLIAGEGLPELPVKAKITRQNEDTYGPMGPEDRDCADGPGMGGPPPASDCGTKAVGWKLDLGYDYQLKDRINLGAYNTDDPFGRCPGVGSDGFPFLVGQVGGYDGKRKLPELPSSELFDPSLGKLILIGRNKKTISRDGYSSQGSSRWVLELKRLKDKR